MSLGVDIPLVWTREHDKDVVPLLEAESQIIDQTPTPEPNEMSNPLIGQRVFQRAIRTLVAILVVVCLITIILIWRKNRSANRPLR